MYTDTKQFEVETLDIPISKIKVINRMRRTDENRIADLAQSIEGIGLLSQIIVAKKDECYLLLAGLHRLEAFKLLKKQFIPARIYEAPDLICKLIEVEENLVRSELNAIQTAEHIIAREELLIKLGRKAVVGSNQYTDEKITNEELASQMNLSRRVYQYKKSVANLNPEVKDILCETDHARNIMNMVKLQKLPDHLQLEIANLLVSGKCKTFRRAWVVAHMKHKQDRWNDNIQQTKDELGIPKSVMKWDRKKDELNDICYLVSHNEEARIKKITGQFGTNEINNYTMIPEQSRWFVMYFSKEGDLVCDNFFGRGTNLIASAYEGRRVLGWDLSTLNCDLVRNACVENTCINADNLTLHNSCGVEMVEYQAASNIIDLFLNDIPYIYGAEDYGNDPRDLCNHKDLASFNERVERCLINMKRLVKPSNWEKKIFKPIIMKVGSSRRNSAGLVDMATEIEIIARKVGLVLHDKIINELRSSFQSYNVGRCIENRYTVKSHETNLVFLKYESSS